MMVWMAQGGDVEVTLVLVVVVSNGDEWWRRWVASMVLCVPSSDGDTHSCRLVFLLQTADYQLFLSLPRGFDLLRQLL